MNLSRKILAALTSLALMVMMVGPIGSVQADELTMDDLQTEVSSLQATIDQLTALIASLQSGATTPVSGGAITGIPADFTFETDLQLGASGDDVHYLQIVLNSDPVTQLATTGVGSPGEETSYFGPLTKGAVINFQEKYADDVLASWGLTSGTGYVGSTTRAKLNELLETGAGTGPSAPVALSVLSVTPESDAVDVAVDAEISAVFSNALNADTVTSDSVYLVDENDQTVDGSVSYSSLAKKVTFAPTADLASGAEYVVILTTDIQAADGTALVEDASWVFTTEGVLIPSEITNAVACVTAGYEWFDGTCHGEVAEVLPSEITDPVECVTAGYEWYDASCHGEGTAAVTGEPLTIALADDTPLGSLILSGSANNKVTKLVFTAADDADATVSGLTVKAYGTANLFALDIAAVKIFDGTKQVGLTQTQVSGISYFIFAPALSIPMGTSRVLDIAVDIAGATFTPSATVKLGIESATSISGTTFTAEFPVVGNAFTVAAGGALGTVNVTQGAPVPVTAVAIGQKDVVLGNFIVTAGTNEDIELTQYNVTYGGSAANGSTCQDADITNVRVKIDGVETGTAVSFATRRASIDFSTPVPITKGTSKVFQVIGDISGAGRVIELSAEIGSIFGVGVISGQGVAGPAVRFDLGAPSLVVFGPGTLAVSVSTASPSGSLANVVRSITPQILGVYDIRAVGENILINTVNLDLSSAAAAALDAITNVGLYNTAGALLSNQITYTTAVLAAATTQTFTMNWQIPANTTEKLYIKGTTNTLTGVGADVVFAQLDLVGGFSIVGTGMSSAGQAGPNNITSITVLALPALTINPAATATTVADASVTPRNQALLGPSAQVVVGSIRVTAQRESQDYRALELTGVPLAGTLAAMFSGLALFDGVNPVTNWVAPVGNVVTFTNAQTITPVTFVLNTPKTLNIVANALTPAAEGRTVRWTTAAAAGTAATLECLQTIGKTSGTIAETGGGDFRANSGNLGANTGGILTLYSDVLAVAKTVASPSGTVARSNNAKLAEWELNAYGSGANLRIDEIVFTSKTGGLAGAGIVVGDFTLYDETNGIALAVAADTLNTIADTDVGTVIAIPTLPLGAGAVAKDTVISGVGAATVYGTDRLYLASGATAVVAIGDVRLMVTAADALAGRTVGSTVILGDADIGTAIAVPTLALGAGAVAMTGNAAAAFVLGTNGLYIAGGATGFVAAADTRVYIGGTALTGAGYNFGSIVVNGAVASTITFNAAGAGNIATVTSGVPLVISLKVDTTSLVKFPQGTQLHWTVNRASDMHLVETTGGAFRAAGIPNGVTTSIPADASIVTIP